MKKIKIRFNTECKDKDADNSLCWRALIDGEEFLASGIEINIPTKTISHTLKGGEKKWSICCESDNYYFDDNKKLVINPSANYDEHVLYVGRFQPPHLGHMAIFEESLIQGKKICIAIRNMRPSEQNPFEAETVKELWEKIYAENPSVMVMVVPNISCIKYGRNVGYDVEEVKVEKKIAAVSATSIRESIKARNDLWKDSVSPLIHEDLENYFKLEECEHNQ